MSDEPSSREPAAARGPDAVAIVCGAALAALLALHFLEPRLAMTWSYAHLGRDAWRVALAALLVAGLPAAGAAAATRAAGLRAPLAPWSRARAAAACAALVAAACALSAIAPAPYSNYDAVVFLRTVEVGEGGPGRWLLGAWGLQRLAAALAPLADARAVVGAANTVLAALGLAALLATARLVLRTRGEWLAVAALVASAFGTLQILLAYVDIYPLSLFAIGGYVWLAARSIERGAHPSAPAAAAALAPFLYIGLVLVVPSFAVVAWAEWRRARSARRIAWACATALAVAGLATVPVLGRPFAWLAYLEAVRASSAAQAGLAAGSSLLPPEYLFTWTHASEVLHDVVLIDAAGWLFLLVAGGALALRRGARALPATAALAIAIAVPYTLYALVMDPVYGAFYDWDLWSPGAGVVTLLGGWALVAWGRDRARLLGVLVGLALAYDATHLLARLNAVQVDSKRHLRESPYHFNLPPGERTPEELKRRAYRRA